MLLIVQKKFIYLVYENVPNTIQAGLITPGF
ncbi:hypothetical protein DM15PD_01660 [Aristophania vespae]|nr:hypothetical protein DM15PD_01660 [Aristophania vespae]